MKPRFTLREIFWATLLVAITCAWMLDHRKLVAHNEQLQAKSRWTSAHPIVAFMEQYLTEEDNTVEWDHGVWIVSPNGKRVGIAPGEDPILPLLDTSTEK